MSYTFPPPPEAPHILPFHIIGYNGEEIEEDEYSITNILHPSREKFHCSKSGKNFDLVMQYIANTDPTNLDEPADQGFLDEPASQAINKLSDCTLTHIVVRAPPSCSAPIRTGILFAHSVDQLKQHPLGNMSLRQMIQSRISGYAHRYNSMTRGQFEALSPVQTSNDGAVTYFTIANRDSLELAINLSPWTQAAIVHVKFIGADSNIDDNIDIERLALVGFETKVPAHIKQMPLALPSTLQLTRRELTDFNPVHPDFMATMINQPCCLLLCTDPMKVEATMARSLVASFAESSHYSNDLNFFYFDRSMDDSSDESESALEELVVSIADHLGVIPMGSKELSDSPKLVIALISKGLKFHYNGKWEAEELRSWFDGFVEGTLIPFRKSLPRPAGDRDPEHEAVTVVTADSFDELVLEDTIKDCILHLSEAWSGSLLTLSIMWHIAALIKQHHPNVLNQFLTVSTMDSANDVAAELFDESELPIIKVFPATSKTDPETFVTYKGPALCSSILQFIHRHMTCRPNDKFDLQRLVAICAPVDEELAERGAKLKQFAELTRLLEEFEFQLSEEQNDAAYQVALQLKPLIDDSKDLNKLALSRHAFATLIEEFDECLRPLAELNDASRLAKASTSLAAELVFMAGNALNKQERHHVDLKVRTLLSIIPNRSETDAIVVFYPLDDACCPPDEPLTGAEINEIRRQASALFALQDSYRPRVEAWRAAQSSQQL